MTVLTSIFLWYRKRGQTTNHFEIRFRATAPDGVLVWLNKGTTVSRDYLSLTLNGGFVELSFNLGTQQTMLIIKSKVSLILVQVKRVSSW